MAAEVKINVIVSNGDKVKKLKSELEKTENLLKRLRTQSSKTNKTLGEISAAETKVKRLRSGMEGLNSATKKVATNANQATTGIKRMGAAAALTTRLMTSLRTTMITTFGVFGAIRLVQNSVKTMADFEKAMAGVKAITGATAEEFKRLSNLALNIGGIFSPTEVAELEVKLAKLGFTIQEIINMTEGIVNLSIATGDDLGTAAELTASTIRGLGLDAAETGKVIDQLGVSFVNSGLDITKYRESIKFIAPIAREMGIELDAITSILGTLADRQISGSIAGTGLRRIFIRMADSSSALSKRIGFTVRSSDDLINAFKKLNKEGVTFAELLDLVDVRSLTATAALIGNTEALEDLLEKVRDSNGAIEEMANIQMDTLRGQAALLSKEWKAFLSTIGGSNGVLKAFVKDFSGFLGTIRGLLQTSEQNITQEADDLITSLTDRFVKAGKNLPAFMVEFQDIIATSQQEIDKFTPIISKYEKALLDLESRYGSLTASERMDIVTIEAGLRKFNAVVTSEKLKIDSINALIKGVDTDKNIKESITKFTDLFKKLKSQGLPAIEALKKTYAQILEPLTDQKVKDAIAVEFDKLLGIETDNAKKRLDLKKTNNTERKKELKSILELDTLRASLVEDDFDRQEALLIAKANFNIETAKLEKDSVEKVKLLNENLTRDLEDLQVKRTMFNERERKKRLTAVLKGLDEAEKLARADFEVAKQQMIADGRTTEQIKKAEIEFEIVLLKARIASTSALTGETDALKLLRKELEALQIASGNVGINVDPDEDGTNTAKLKEKARAFKQFAQEFTQSMSRITDSIVESADRRVDAVNNAISETQSALQIELDLNKQGFASNVAAKQAELNALKAARERALEDQRKALAVQRTIENAVQAINLATAISALIKSFVTTLGPFGILASIGAGATLFAVFESLTKQATQVADKFEVGGWRELGGKRHSQGGVNLGEMGEAEKGEVVSVFNRGAVRKHKGLITNFTDMVNSGNFNMQHDIIGDVGKQAVIVNSNVSLDDSKQIDKMNGLLEKSLTQDNVKMFGNNKVIRKGTKTRFIRG